jgi:hypothetical protein
MKISAMKGRTALNGLLFSLPLHQGWIENVFVLLHPKAIVASCVTATVQQHQPKKT